MLKPQKQKEQMESLRKTKSTKEQILKKIEESSVEELKSMVPEAPPGLDKEYILKNAEKMLQGDKLPENLDSMTEAIVNVIGRPVYFIQNGQPVLSGTDIEKFKGLVENAINNLDLLKTINAIGRIELNNHPDYLWVGTGWLFAENLLMTNRHVAQLFIENAGTEFRFQKFLNASVEARIDFLAEHENSNSAEFIITECLYIGASKYEDIAILRVTLNSPAYIPLSIFGAPLREREDIAVIGYPAYDSQSMLQKDQLRIYNNIFDVKRFAPGKISQLYTGEGVAIHDATTLGGNSGSAVVSLETGKVIGLHFAGKESYGNFCVDAPTILRVINKLPSQKIFSTSPPARQPLPTFPSLGLEANKNCALETYNKVQVPSFKISGRIITYASPDSTFFVTKNLFKKAKESILIGIYDFTAEHVYTCIEEAIGRGVSVSLMLDLEGENENNMFKKLKKQGVECVPAPACTSKNARYFSSAHEKVIVLDNKWTMIQSGNYSNNSCPFNELNGDSSQGFKAGNRDMGIAIESAPLARFFTKILRSDMKLELTAAGLEGFELPLKDKDFLLEAPRRIPEPLFPSNEFNPDDSIKIQPVLTPDNYVDEVEALLKTATRSVRIEQQYIRVDQNLIQRLLKAIPKNLDVQIIIAHPIGADNVAKTMKEFNTLKDEYGFDVRFLSRKLVHCHNKLIVIDDDKVLISSQNWSNSAVAKNREAGVIVYDKEITKYFRKIFDADWTMSDEEVEEAVGHTPEMRLESFGERPGKYIRIDAGDVQEV